jgi:hypothetical protein
MATITYARIIPPTILTTSSLLILISAIQFGVTGHAMKILATLFPGDSYAWYGAPGSAFDNYEDVRFVYLQYNGMTETEVFVGAGLSVVAGGMGLLAHYSRRWVRMAVCAFFLPLVA